MSSKCVIFDPCGWKWEKTGKGGQKICEEEMSPYTFRVNSINDSAAFSGNTFVFIRKCSYTSLFLFSFLQAVLSVTEWHSGRKQTAKVIIICGHAAPHLTDGDNMSKHFSIKKRQHKQTEGKRKHVRVHTKGTRAVGRKKTTRK